MAEVLNCDAEYCGHVEHVERITEEHVGMPCPCCGANLLTEGDWEAWKPIQALMLAMEDAGLVGITDEGKAELSVSLHGNKTKIEIENP